MTGLFATFLEKKVAPKNFQREVFSAHSGLDRDVSTNQSVKVLVKLFQKLAQVKGAKPLAPSAEGEILLSFDKRRRGLIYLPCKERGRTLVGGSPLFMVAFMVAF